MTRNGVAVLDSTVSGRFSEVVFEDRAVGLTVPAHEADGQISLPAIDPVHVVGMFLDADPLPLEPEKPVRIVLRSSRTPRRLTIYLRR